VLRSALARIVAWFTVEVFAITFVAEYKGRGLPIFTHTPHLART
jgi:hypothetical protein